MLKKILKSKRIIACILIFTLTFMSVSHYQKKEVQAAFVVDDVILIILGLAVIGTGVIATSNGQVRHMGSQVWDKLVDMGVQSLDEIVKLDNQYNKYVIMNDLVVEAVNFVAENLPTANIEYTAGNPVAVTNGFEFVLPDSPELGDIYSFGSYNLSPVNKQLEIQIGRVLDGTLYINTQKYSTVPIEIYYYLKVENYKFSNGTRPVWILYSKIDDVVTQHGNFELYNDLMGIKFIGATGTKDDVINIPYTPENSANFHQDTITTNIPWNRGIDDLGNATSIGAIAVNSPVIDEVINRDITRDAPLVWDDVKTGLLEKSIVGDVVQDKSIVGDEVETGLFGWLKTLIDFIINLLKSILDFLLNLLNNLLLGLFNLIKSLFVPTITVSELFSVPSGSGFGAILDLFNFNSLWSIEPRPYKFKTNMFMNDLSGTGSSRNWDIELNIFDNKVVNDNLGILRNVLSYSTLIGVIYFIVYHFLPKRDMD